MSDESTVEEVVTSFILNTCRLRPQFTKPAVEAVADCVALTTLHPRNDYEEEEVDYIPLTTGSVAEFYIEPMLPHIGDIDVMYHCSNELAIPQGHPPPTQLPDEFHNFVEVLEIIDSHLTGYVYLELRYLLFECVDEGRYNAVEYEMECDRPSYLVHRPNLIDRYNCGYSLKTGHGPAIYNPAYQIFLPVDRVPCVHCMMWPPEAADWPTRHRNYGWPDSATVDRVISNGCDVVGVAHRQCKQHEWMGERQ